MSDKPLVSCIMPTKNRRRFVERAAEMFLSQAYFGGAELIVLEDGDEDCNDLLYAVWSEYSEYSKGHCSRLGSRFEYHRFKGTLGAKLNEGARLARGKYIINWDDDDFHHPQRIANVVRHFELTGASMIGMASMPYWREGDKGAWIYNAGDARYCTGSGQAFLRDWALANPHPDQTVAEDEYMCRIAAEQGVLSTISGTDWVVACTHDAHCTNRQSPLEGELERIFGRPADNWQRVPISKFDWVQKWAFSKTSA